MLLENSSARVFAILQAIFKGMALHGLPPSRSASPFAAHQPGLNGLSKVGLVSLQVSHGCHLWPYACMISPSLG